MSSRRHPRPAPCGRRRKRRFWRELVDWLDGLAFPRAKPRRHRRPRGGSKGIGQAARELGPVLFALPLAGFTAVLLWNGAPSAAASVAPPDRENGKFAACQGSVRVTCVVDGDTFWYRGAKIRIADINAPEISEPHCPREAELGRAATIRFTQLLNAGPFTLVANPDGRDADVYGRKLRVVTRGGVSLGQQLVREGLAERWRGYRGDWC